MEVTIGALRELHRIHQQLTDLRERLERGPKQIHARESNATRLEQDLAKAHADTKTARVVVDHKQLDLKTGEGRILDLKRKLNACGSNREYQALVEQIAAAEMANSVLADEILEALEKVDQSQKAAVEIEANLAKSKEEVAKIRTAVQAQKSTLEADIQRLETDLKEAESGLPIAFKEAYERIVRSRGEDAMAPVENDTCGGCFHSIPPNVVNMLSLSRAVFCKSCGRLLYLPEDYHIGETS
ncbi:MAG: zinc ribbon domain-containing protein [Pirellulales bacterium]|jgi:uncharacterized protein